ncbi:MAG: hypothetical protein FWH48_11220 [Oscillospiraceae bacterium]|nr:hypothetical protein [Oscillospiraceae bacterium]
MENYTKEELEEALRSLTSTLGKCEKVQKKLVQATSQWTLLTRRIKSFEISIDLIKREIEKIQGNDYL